MIGSLIWKCCLYPLPLSHHTNQTESSSFSGVYQSFFKCCSVLKFGQFLFGFGIRTDSSHTFVCYQKKPSLHQHITVPSIACVVGLEIGRTEWGFLSLSGGWCLAWEQIPGSRKLFKISDSESLVGAVDGQSANVSLLNLSRILEVQNVTLILKNAAICKCLCP